eukprot:CAMPEP_0119490962 /NCGR_PEP_ID=MMETSP1344-20130328/15980_1 /TAXON_ID=236787 /ORGANISM="Florenciella parvula, Strain CCMP2471" /LENGTH=696 /DNA_ID=CAMNT_0007526175 /DNA_START=36 /DNA_END=2123 /DNA_ORIENTATION=+
MKEDLVVYRVNDEDLPALVDTEQTETYEIVVEFPSADAVDAIKWADSKEEAEAEDAERAEADELSDDEYVKEFVKPDGGSAADLNEEEDNADGAEETKGDEQGKAAVPTKPTLPPGVAIAEFVAKPGMFMPENLDVGMEAIAINGAAVSGRANELIGNLMQIDGPVRLTFRGERFVQERFGPKHMDALIAAAGEGPINMRFVGKQTVTKCFKATELDLSTAFPDNDDHDCTATIAVSIKKAENVSHMKGCTATFQLELIDNDLVTETEKAIHSASHHATLCHLTVREFDGGELANRVMDILTRRGGYVTKDGSHAFDGIEIVEMPVVEFDEKGQTVRDDPDAPETAELMAKLDALKAKYGAAHADTDEVGAAMELINRASDAKREELLKLAVVRGNHHWVDILAVAGTNLNSVDRYGRTPLMCAAQAKQYKIANLLVDLEVDIYLTDANNRSVLFYLSAFPGEEGMFNFALRLMSIPGRDLLHCGLSPNLPDSTDQRPIDMAIATGPSSPLACLLKVVTGIGKAKDEKFVRTLDDWDHWIPGARAEDGSAAKYCIGQFILYQVDTLQHMSNSNTGLGQVMDWGTVEASFDGPEAGFFVYVQRYRKETVPDGVLNLNYPYIPGQNEEKEPEVVLIKESQIIMGLFNPDGSRMKTMGSSKKVPNDLTPIDVVSKAFVVPGSKGPAPATVKVEAPKMLE